jgi:hypothetical protein
MYKDKINRLQNKIDEIGLCPECKTKLENALREFSYRGNPQ